MYSLTTLTKKKKNEEKHTINQAMKEVKNMISLKMLKSHKTSLSDLHINLVLHYFGSCFVISVYLHGLPIVAF